MTFNIHSAIGRDGRVDIGRIAEIVRPADIVALQEIDNFWDRSGNVAQSEALARLLPDHTAIWQPNIDVFKDGGVRRQFGNLFLSRFPVLTARRHALPKSVQSGRLGLQCGVLETVLQTPLGNIRVYNAHLLTGDRDLHVARLMEICTAAAVEGPPVSGMHEDRSWFDEPMLEAIPAAAMILGDLNTRPTHPAYRQLIDGSATGFVDVRRATDAADDVEFDDGATYFTDFSIKRGERLDHCLITADLAAHVTAVEVLANTDASDHQPLLISFG